MSGKESLRNGILVLVLLIGFGVMSAVWPILAGTSTQSRTRVPVETEVVEITIPFSDPAEVMSLTSLQILGMLGGAVVVLIGGAGVVIGVLYGVLSRQTDAVKESESYQSNVAALEKRETERIKAMRDGRKSAPMPQHKMPRWSVISTSLIILMFAAFVGLVINGTFYPEGELDLESGRTIASSWLTVGIPVLLALLVAIWRVRPQGLETAVATDNAPIPWDFIAVLIAGLLVVGLGIGLIVYYNVPI
ncbi:MAG: hypothetical protein H6658_16820 [Ardenticatenaceae bacterium]|nr:hypothetical protein [Ardenticatenaceae bacterium]